MFGTLQFRLFNMEYQYTIDDLPGWLGIPHGEGVLCEAPLDSDWSSEAFEFWKN